MSHKTKNIVILGGLWGDEAKGSWTHRLSTNYDYVLRTGGSSNCGHSIYRDNVKYVHHLIPSVDWRNPRPQAFLGSGMVINPEELLSEVTETLVNFKDAATRITVDPYAFVVTPDHIELDKQKNKHIGTTNKGVGPAYTSKFSRSGIRIVDIMDSDSIKELISLGVRFKTAYQLLAEIRNKSCIFEGAQGVMLDINHGTFPFVTSSDTTLSGVGASGFNSINIDRVYGVTKAYVTRVGEGPFPTELDPEGSERLRKLGNEVGSTTGRNRRVGWLDLPALKYACDMGGITHLIVTKLDVLAGMEEIPVCVGYESPIFGPKSFFDAKPIFKTMPGWKDAKDIHQPEIKNYLEMISLYTQRPIAFVSTGVNVSDMKSYF
jgi:adenylosuccinate synthase